MNLTNLFILCPLVFFAGLVDSVAGGGGMISLPAYLAAGLPPHMALGSNKFSSVCGTTISCARFIASKQVDFRTALISAIFALIGSSLGAMSVQIIDASFVAYLIVGITPFVAYFVLKKKELPVDDRSAYHSLSQIFVYSSLIGITIGFYDGFFGPGTGTFLMIIYVYFLHYDMVMASGNSKIVNLASNIAAVITFIAGGNVYFAFAIPAALCNILGGYIGSGLAIKGGSKIIRPMLVVVLVLLIVFVILKYFFGLFSTSKM